MFEIINEQDEKLCVLDDFYDAVLVEQINAESSISFSYYSKNDYETIHFKTQYIHENALIKYGDDIYYIVSIEKDFLAEGIIFNVFAEQYSNYLIKLPIAGFVYYHRTAKEMLEILLEDTVFEVGDVADTTLKSIDIGQKTNKRDILQKIAELFNLQIYRKAKKIGLVETLGEDNGASFIYGKNIKKLTEKRQIGEDGNSVISFVVEIVDLSQLSEYKGLDKVNVGDIVTVYAYDGEVDLKMHVLRVEREISTGLANVNSIISISSMSPTLSGQTDDRITDHINEYDVEIRKFIEEKAAKINIQCTHQRTDGNTLVLLIDDLILTELPKHGCYHFTLTQPVEPNPRIEIRSRALEGPSVSLATRAWKRPDGSNVGLNDYIVGARIEILDGWSPVSGTEAAFFSTHSGGVSVDVEEFQVAVGRTVFIRRIEFILDTAYLYSQAEDDV